MSKNIVTFGLILFTLVCSGQSLKYKDLVPLLPSYSPEQQKTTLKEFLLEDLDHPNANFRLALLYEQNYRKTDPLASYPYAMANAEQARIRFFKSRQVIDEREISRNNEYYAPIFNRYDAKGKPDVPFTLVQTKLTGGYDSADLFIRKMPAIYSSFTKSVNNYDQAVRLFAQITREYQSPEDLLLLHDAALDERLSQLKMRYDSCIYYLDNYLALTREYPLNGHRQEYKIHRIETYRLDGLLTRLNFLTNHIDLWNYAAWVDEVRKTVQTDIATLRHSIQNSYQSIESVLEKAQTATTDLLPTPVTLDKQMVYNLNHFDRQSALLALLEYKEFLQHWNIQNRGKQLDTISSDRNAEVYSGLIYSNRKADSLLQDFRSRISLARVNKHKDFVSAHFGGLPGIEKYALEEQKKIEETFKAYVDELRENITHRISVSEGFVTKENMLKAGRFNVPLLQQPATPEGLDQGILFTQFNRRNPDASAYVAGIYKPDKKKNLVATFVARINPDGKLGWFKEFSVSVDSAVQNDAHTYLGPVVLTQEGCAFVVRSLHATRGDAINTFIYVNEKGEEKIRTRIPETSYPRFIKYSEKTNSFLLTLKGVEERQNFAQSERIQLFAINVLGQLVWKKELEMTGTVTDLVSLIDGYLLTGNYMVMRDGNGKEFRTKVGSFECSPFLIKFNEQGDILTTKPIETPNSVYLQRVVKINDNSINLLCYPEKLDVGMTKTFAAEDRTIHILTNRLTQIVSVNY